MRAQIKLATDAEYYTFPINPVSFNDNNNMDYASNKTIDGRSIEQYAYHDGRYKNMTWKNLPNRSPYHGTPTSLINVLRSFIMAGECHLLLNDLDQIGGSSARKSIKVIDVSTTLNDGAGPYNATGHLKFDTVVMTYVEILPSS